MNKNPILTSKLSLVRENTHYNSNISEWKEATRNYYASETRRIATDL